jgi:hypothetical protein
MKLPREYLIALLGSEFNKFRVQLTWRWRSGPTAIYIHTEGMGKTQMNIFENNYCRWRNSNTCVLLRRNNINCGCL